jgi:hypothetical protein
MTQITPVQTESTQTQLEMSPSETLEVAREMALAYRSMVDFYRKNYQAEDGGKLTLEGAEQLLGSGTRREAAQEARARMHQDPKEISWHDLEAMARGDELMPFQVWEEMKAIALDHQRRGGLMLDAAKGMHGQEPFEKAQMIAIRHELRATWHPQNGIEEAIIEQMALAHWQVFQWMNRLQALETMHDRWLRLEDRKATLPRVSEAEASATAAAMIDRFNKMFLRCARSLRDLRRYPVTVNAPGGQVNIGEKQINVAPAAEKSIK